MPAAVNGAAFAAFVASGQTCVSGTRILIQEQVYDEFMAFFLEKVESIKCRMGDRECRLSVVASVVLTSSTAANPLSTMGTVISHKSLDRIDAMVKRSSGTILAGGERLQGKSELDGFDFSQGAFYPPTVVTDVGLEDELWIEEVFGPVVVVKKFSVSLMIMINASCNLTDEFID